jgi:hypothetical protein
LEEQFLESPPGNQQQQKNIMDQLGPGGTMGTARRDLGGAGTQTAGLSVWWISTTSVQMHQLTTEEYDGSAWTAGGNLNTARYQN